MSYTVMTITTAKFRAVLKDIGSYLEQQKFKNKSDYFYHKMGSMYVYVDENATSIVLRLFVLYGSYSSNVQISRRFSLVGLGLHSISIARVCERIRSISLEVDGSAQIQIGDKDGKYQRRPGKEPEEVQEWERKIRFGRKVAISKSTIVMVLSALMLLLIYFVLGGLIESLFN